MLFGVYNSDYKNTSGSTARNSVYMLRCTGEGMDLYAKGSKGCYENIGKRKVFIYYNLPNVSAGNVLTSKVCVRQTNLQM